MNSGTVLAGTDGFTSITYGVRAMLPTGSDIANEVEIELFIECRINRVRRNGQEKRISVRWRAHYCFGSDVAASTRSVLDNELLAESIREPLTDQAREDVDWAASGKPNHQSNRPDRINLRPREL